MKVTHSIRGRAKYIKDYDTHKFSGGFLYSAMGKRIAFIHEKEVRLAKQVHKKPIDDQPLGIEVDWDPKKYVQAIFVDPYASKYHFDAVKALLTAFDWSVSPKWSEIRRTPKFYHWPRSR